MTIKDPKGFAAGIQVLEDAVNELEAQLRDMDGICKQCAEGGNMEWPTDTSMHVTGPCHSCGDKRDTVLVPYDDLKERD